jgi:TetR/AcrR family transcriptional regulator
LSKKELIINVASKHFSEYGYERASLDVVAKEVGVTKPAIYYHFKDKYALYEAVLCSKFSALLERMQSVYEVEEPKDALRAYVETFGNFLLEHPCFAAMFARELADGAKNIPQSCTKSLSQILKLLSTILLKGEEEGVFGKENPFMIQLMIVSTLINYKTTKKLREGVVMNLADIKNIDIELKDIIENLANKIVKAVQC